MMIATVAVRRRRVLALEFYAGPVLFLRRPLLRHNAVQLIYLVAIAFALAVISRQRTKNMLTNMPRITNLEIATFVLWGPPNAIKRSCKIVFATAELKRVCCFHLIGTGRVYNSQFELTSRRLFLWRKDVEEQKEKVADMRRKNEALVYNVLPPHVAKVFLGRRRLDEDLYSKSHDAVGVLFAAMPNFSDFYTEESVNNQGLECLRFLNEVISDFDAVCTLAIFTLNCMEGSCASLIAPCPYQFYDTLSSHPSLTTIQRYKGSVNVCNEQCVYAACAYPWSNMRHRR
ncbi:hypothetical protein HPB48_009640 [Haemaphysalis longicornis]|uniref:adenylate cyclase n=1 Tax=Haemaphysalis longicornis TaxID=44386 RepID=A0A9J6GDE8_HAELO|nr:hypothetical protein HPB48_009640 [Haemaphysalis longicornis]